MNILLPWHWFRDVVHHADHQDERPRLPPIAIDEDGWMLGEGVERVPSPRHQRLATSSRHIEMLVNHWTATGRGTAAALCRRIQSMPKEGEHAASWHILFPRDPPKIYQSVSLERGSWHAGGDSAARFVRDKATGAWKKGVSRLSANGIAGGLEFECVGEVRRVAWGKGAGAWMGWPFNRPGKDGKPRPGPIVPDSEVVEWEGKMYHDYTEHQRRSYERVLMAIEETYHLTAESCCWSHEMIDPSRKSDAGPIWMERYLPEILGRVYGED